MRCSLMGFLSNRQCLVFDELILMLYFWWLIVDKYPYNGKTWEEFHGNVQKHTSLKHATCPTQCALSLSLHMIVETVCNNQDPPISPMSQRQFLPGFKNNPKPRHFDHAILPSMDGPVESGLSHHAIASWSRSPRTWLGISQSAKRREWSITP